MENLKELDLDELIEIDGGATFAYRVGEFIRFAGHAYLLGVDTASKIVYSWQ